MHLMGDLFLIVYYFNGNEEGVVGWKFEEVFNVGFVDFASFIWGFIFKLMGVCVYFFIYIFIFVFMGTTMSQLYSTLLCLMNAINWSDSSPPVYPLNPLPTV
jgi:hypothetical protein